MDITPPHLRCGMGSCPSVHVLEDGRLGVRGEFLVEHVAGEVSPEATVAIPAEYFSDLPELVRLRERVSDLEARLEIDHHFELREGEMTRVEVPAEDREIGQGDGIDCRDATICLQDEHIVKLKARIEELEKALKPFAASHVAENVDDHGWTSNIHREQISVWFGPSDFRRARAALSRGKETA